MGIDIGGTSTDCAVVTSSGGTSSARSCALLRDIAQQQFDLYAEQVLPRLKEFEPFPTSEA
jgi:N-methylhydantoinase A/oxoprolinase/acetone carboxylase beta subunit